MGSAYIGGHIISHAFRWTAQTGPVVIGFLPGMTSTVAHGVSEDGVAVVGASSTGMTSTNRAFRWRAGEGMIDLGILPGATRSEAHAASSDGSVVVGASSAAAFRWTQADGMRRIGSGVALCVTADGTVAAGSAPDTLGDRAAYWDERGPHFLHAELGSILPAGWTLLRITGVSDDGATFAGTGRIAGGNEEAFLATIHCAADFNRNRRADSSDFFDYLTAFFSDEVRADINGDHVVDSEDFFAFLVAFFAGC